MRRENATMADEHAIQVHRKARLRELIAWKCHDLIVDLANAINRSESYIGRMLYEPGKNQWRPVSDKMVRVISAAFDLPPGWFDMPLGSGMDESSTTPSPNVLMHHSTEKPVTNTVIWPFKTSSYKRLQDLRKSLGPRDGAAAIRDIDAHLDVVMTKWEQQAARRARAA